MGRNDTIKEVESMASKILKFKIWPSTEDQATSSVCSAENKDLARIMVLNRQGQWRQSVQDIEGEVLCGMA